MNVVWP